MQFQLELGDIEKNHITITVTSKKLSLNKLRKSLWINLGNGKVWFSGGKGPQKKLEKRKSEWE